MAHGFIISIHAPHEGCDAEFRRFIVLDFTFQSTHPMRGATALSSRLFRFCFPFQSTHPMRGATAVKSGVNRYEQISIHAPHEGCDWASSVPPSGER